MEDPYPQPVPRASMPEERSRTCSQTATATKEFRGLQPKGPGGAGKGADAGSVFRLRLVVHLWAGLPVAQDAVLANGRTAMGEMAGCASA